MAANGANQAPPRLQGLHGRLGSTDAEEKAHVHGDLSRAV
ncbi:hypothetical protein ACP4OV_029665 [Aristida adscensionis]